MSKQGGLSRKEIEELIKEVENTTPDEQVPMDVRVRTDKNKVKKDSFFEEIEYDEEVEEEQPDEDEQEPEEEEAKEEITITPEEAAVLKEARKETTTNDNEEDTEPAEEVNNLELIENVFDKRINDQQIETHKLLEANKNTSARLLDKKDIELKTDLNPLEITLIARARMVSFRYEVPLLYDFCDDLMILKVSRERRGRKEFIEGLHAEEKKDTQPSFLQRMFGGGGQP